MDTVMTRSTLKDFESRLAKIDRIHKAGGAFEASGALGRAYFDANRPKARRRIPLRGLAAVLAGAILFKAAVFAQLGGEVYDGRVAALQAGSGLDQAAAWILHADEVTRYLGEKLRPLIRNH